MKKLSVVDISIYALLIAMQIVLSRFLSISAWNFKIGFSFLPIAIAGMLFGYIPGFLVGFFGDFLGAILFPQGNLFLPFSLTAGLAGLIFAFFLFKKEKSIIRIMFSALTYVILNTLLLNSLWISILYGNEFYVIFFARIPQALLMFVIISLTLDLLNKSLLKNLSGLL